MKKPVPYKTYARLFFNMLNAAKMQGLTYQQIEMMCFLFVNRGGMKQEDIREHIGISKSACYDLMHRLEEIGDVYLVEQKPRVYALTIQGALMVKRWYVNYLKLVNGRA